MLQRYSLAEARARLPHVVDLAESGVEVEFTRRGRPVAVLISRREFDRLKGKRLQFGELYRDFIRKHSLTRVGVAADFFASIRDKSAGRKVTL